MRSFFKNVGFKTFLVRLGGCILSILMLQSSKPPSLGGRCIDCLFIFMINIFLLALCFYYTCNEQPIHSLWYFLQIVLAIVMCIFVFKSGHIYTSAILFVMHSAISMWEIS